MGKEHAQTCVQLFPRKIAVRFLGHPTKYPVMKIISVLAGAVVAALVVAVPAVLAAVVMLSNEHSTKEPHEKL